MFSCIGCRGSQHLVSGWSRCDFWLLPLSLLFQMCLNEEAKTVWLMMMIWGVWQTWTATPPMYSRALKGCWRGGWQILCDAALQVGVDISRGNFQSQKVTTEQIFKFSFSWHSKYVSWQNRIYEIEFRLDKRFFQKKTCLNASCLKLKEIGVILKQTWTYCLLMDRRKGSKTSKLQSSGSGFWW